jgi:hypothetical protein
MVRRPVRLLCTALLAVLAASLLLLAAWPDGLPDSALHRPETAAIPMAVIGDSGSHSYQDTVTFPPGGWVRGGAFRERTFQWTEVLDRMRGAEIDQGPWVRWGRPGLVAWLRDLLGLGGGRSPEKEDYLYNFANSGASCKHVMGERLGERYRQVPRLLALMDQEPARWRRGVVVINIGGNDWTGLLDEQASDPTAPQLREVIRYCADQVQAAITAIHAAHPSTRIMLVGLANEADDPVTFDGYRSAAATANINQALGAFDNALRRIAAKDPARIGFTDFDEWFGRLWGERGPNGEPAYRSVAIGTLQVSNTSGDAPENAWLADHHAGMALNALWGQHFVDCLRQEFGLQLTPISDQEVIRFVTGQWHGERLAPSAPDPGAVGCGR